MLLGKLTKTKEAFVQLLKKLGFVMHVTLNGHIKKHRDGIPSSIHSYSTESKQVFSEAQESELESNFKKAADVYFGLSQRMFES